MQLSCSSECLLGTLAAATLLFLNCPGAALGAPAPAPAQAQVPRRYLTYEKDAIVLGGGSRTGLVTRFITRYVVDSVITPD